MYILYYNRYIYIVDTGGRRVLNAHLDGCVPRSRGSTERFLRLRGLIREEDGVTVYTIYKLLRD